MSLLLLLRSPAAAGLQGAIPAQSNVTGNLTVPIGLQGASAGQSDVTGNLTVTIAGGALVGTSTAQSAVAGQITVLRPLQGQITAQSSVTWAQPSGARGKFVLTKARVVIEGVDISRLTQNVEFLLDREEIDVTPLGSPYRDHIQGQQTGQYNITVFNDPTVFTPAFWASLDTPATIELTPRSDLATGPDNPKWTGDGLTVRKTTLAGQPGEASVATVELTATGPVTQSVT